MSYSISSLICLPPSAQTPPTVSRLAAAAFAWYDFKAMSMIVSSGACWLSNTCSQPIISSIAQSNEGASGCVVRRKGRHPGSPRCRTANPETVWSSALTTGWDITQTASLRLKGRRQVGWCKEALHIECHSRRRRASPQHGQNDDWRSKTKEDKRSVAKSTHV